jgi:L-seryl-tRNA(Ser) seleniumtransferase
MRKRELLRKIPSVDEILKSPHGLEWQARFPRRYTLKAVRDVVESKREEILKGNTPDITMEALAEEIGRKIESLTRRSLRPVINATGIVIHTNLGRAPLPESALKNIVEVARGYSNLEYNLGDGRRGKRYDHIRWIVRDITGAEDAIIVNNNAAAVLLCLSALVKGKEVIVSRGELVEIGGAFRIPDVMIQSGALLREVGTTNKTHLRDYEESINENTGLILKTHQSNFKIIGFTEEVTLENLVEIGKSRGIPVMYDLGSGCFIGLEDYGIKGEPIVQDVLKTGVDIVTFSGDKLLGGPQAGIIVGRKVLIERIARHPLTRAVRIDKLTLSALEAVLMEYADPESARRNIPVIRSLLEKDESIRRRARKVYRMIRREIGDVEVAISRDSTLAGGGSLPGVYLPTYVVALRSERVSTPVIEKRLRTGNHPVITRLKEDRVLIDVRTVLDSEIKLIIEAVKEALR